MTTTQLRALWERSRDPHDASNQLWGTDVRRLLWEIHRLRALALRTSDVLRHIEREGGATVPPIARDLIQALRRDLDAETVVQESDFRRVDFERRTSRE